MSEHSINQPTEEELLRWGGRGRGLPSLPSMPSLVSGTSMGKQQTKCSASSGFSCEVGFFLIWPFLQHRMVVRLDWEQFFGDLERRMVF